MYLQNGLYINMDITIVTANNTFFHTYSQPNALRIDCVSSTNGRPPSSVPAGQINLQK